MWTNKIDVFFYCLIASNILLNTQATFIGNEILRENEQNFKKYLNSLQINPADDIDGKVVNENIKVENESNDFLHDGDGDGNKNDKLYNYHKYNNNNDQKKWILQQENKREEGKNNVKNDEGEWILVKKPQQDANESFRKQLSNINESTESGLVTYQSKNKRAHKNNNNYRFDGHKRNNMRPNNEIPTEKFTTSYAGRVDNYNYKYNTKNNNNNNKNKNNNQYNEKSKNYNRYAVYYGNYNNNNNRNNELNNIYNNNSEQLNNSQLLSMSLLNGDDDVGDVPLPQKHISLKSDDDVLIGVDNKAMAELPTKAHNCVDADTDDNNDDNNDDVLVPYDTMLQIDDTTTTNDDNYSDELNMNLLYGIQNAAPRKKRSSSLTSTSYQSLCPTTRSVIPLETELYEYRPQTYIEVKCAHTYMPHLEYDPNKNKICSEAGFYCIQLNRTIQLIRRRKHISSECWESEMRIVPSGCECMWPKHNYGDIITYHFQPQKRIPKPLQLLKMQNEPQESEATKQTRATNDFDWQMSPSKRQLTLNDVRQRQARTPTTKMTLSNAITDHEFY